VLELVTWPDGHAKEMVGTPLGSQVKGELVRRQNAHRIVWGGHTHSCMAQET
jgi:hypothetical protein